MEFYCTIWKWSGEIRLNRDVEAIGGENKKRKVNWKETEIKMLFW